MGSTSSSAYQLVGCEFAKAVIRVDEAKGWRSLMEEHARVVMTRGTLRLIERKVVSPTTAVITLSLPVPLKLAPGGHIRISGPRGSRSYTPCRISDTSFSIAVKRYDNGEVSPYIFESKEGDFIRVTGPLDPLFSVVGVKFDVAWFIGGGTGIAPMLSMASYCAAKGTCKKIVLIGCFRDKADCILGEEMRDLALQFSAIVESHFVFSRVATGGSHLGLNVFGGRFCADHARQLPAPSQAVICGPPSFDDTVSLVLADVSLSEDHIAVM